VEEFATQDAVSRHHEHLELAKQLEQFGSEGHDATGGGCGADATGQAWREYARTKYDDTTVTLST